MADILVIEDDLVWAALFINVLEYDNRQVILTTPGDVLLAPLDMLRPQPIISALVPIGRGPVSAWRYIPTRPLPTVQSSWGVP